MAVHVFQPFHYRARFCIVLIIGGAWETIGYALRAAGSRNEESLAPYATQLTLIVLTPAFVAAFTTCSLEDFFLPTRPTPRPLGNSIPLENARIAEYANLYRYPSQGVALVAFFLYASCILIMLRSAYRVVEFAQGFDGYLASHGVYFYVLEAVPMMPPFILFNIFHPERLVKGGFKGLEFDANSAEFRSNKEQKLRSLERVHRMRKVERAQ
ncbi:RTA1-domain-containing protein [Stipitochalara longipes BDJ]|nr:RTA1-domain-containing protein [Stipitochalara longipes BDJ]